jgi:hypothetical protein
MMNTLSPSPMSTSPSQTTCPKSCHQKAIIQLPKTHRPKPEERHIEQETGANYEHYEANYFHEGYFVHYGYASTHYSFVAHSLQNLLVGGFIVPHLEHNPRRGGGGGSADTLLDSNSL